MQSADPTLPVSEPTLLDRIPTAPLAATGLIGGFAVAIGSGSRPLGGAVMALFGLSCIYFWVRRDGVETAVKLTLIGLAAFVLSHVLGRLIGAWPSVFLVSAVTAWFCWRWSDARMLKLTRATSGR